MTDNVASGHRDVAIRFEAVRFVVPVQNATAPPETFCNLEAMKLLLGHIYIHSRPNTMFLGGQMVVSHDMYGFWPISSYSTDLVSVFQSFVYLTSHILCR